MIDNFKKLKHDLVSVFANTEGQSDLNILDVVGNYERYICDFELAVELLHKTVVENDEIAIQCALTRVRIASLNLSNIYQDIIDDIVLINKSDLWPEIPEGYQIPERYNYPKK